MEVYAVIIKENDIVVGAQGIPVPEISYETDGLRIVKKLCSDNAWKLLIDLDCVDCDLEDEVQLGFMHTESLRNALNPIGFTVEIESIEIK